MRRHNPNRTIKQKLAWSVAALLMAVFAATGALAQQDTGATGFWQFGVSIYGWFPTSPGRPFLRNLAAAVISRSTSRTSSTIWNSHSWASSIFARAAGDC